VARRAPDYVSGEGAITSRAPGLYAPGSRGRADMVQKAYTEYAWLLNFVSEDPSMQKFFDWVVRKFQENQERDVPLDRPFEQAEFDREFEKTDTRKRYTAYEIERRREAADPRLQKDFEFRTETQRNTIRDIADRYGIPLSDEELERLTEQATFQGWDDVRIRRALEPILEQSLTGEDDLDLMGQAGDAETQLMNWLGRNGLQLSRQALAKYISNIAMGRQSIEDAQADIRKTYLAGMYPGWADKINEGFDPADLFEPYMNVARNVLELDSIDFNDPVIKRFTQGVGADGNPTKMPLWEFEQELRNDPRWQQTDNAYQMYTNVGTNLLKMFGFR
jgi:hypothetical protein